MNKTGFFEEWPGQKSITRIAFLLIVITSLFISIYQVICTGHYDITEFLSMMGTATGLKLWQKNIENKIYGKGLN
jgi:hypothetical protein